MAPETNEFLRTKDSLVKYYQNISSAQAVRLVAFSAGLFTLLGAIQVSPDQKLRVFFKDLPSIMNFGFTPTGLAIINFIFLFVSVSILAFFIFRAIFRYTSYAIIANEFIYIRENKLTEPDQGSKNNSTENIDERSLHSKISDAVVKRVTEEDPKKLFGVVPISWFFSYDHSKNNTQLRKGLLLSFVFSFFSTCLILLLLW